MIVANFKVIVQGSFNTMLRRNLRHMLTGQLLLLIGLTLSVCGSARAASPQDTASLEAANMVGILEYCSAQKHASAEDVAHARSILTHRSALPPQVELEQAEHLGQGGILLAAGVRHSLSELGRQTQQSIGSICGGLAMNAGILADMLSSPSR